jgi:23S rRNA pseudouridine1911/1915/1917 synthase
VYHLKPDGGVRPDLSQAPRLALHAAELGFTHPVTMDELHWAMPLPPDLQLFLDRLRRAGGKTPASEHDDADSDQVDR